MQCVRACVFFAALVCARASVPEEGLAACSLAFDRGSCSNFSAAWYFDTTYGGCSRFTYGGCEGNGNRFATKDDCEATCVSPPPKDACKLPASKGPCDRDEMRWFFDNERGSCSQFIYGDCLGNKNNFKSREECQEQCEPDTFTDTCELPIEQGSCAGNFPRWGFNKASGKCDQFVWGGCEGNSNRFSTEAACNNKCNQPGKPKRKVKPEGCTDNPLFPDCSVVVEERDCIASLYAIFCCESCFRAGHLPVYEDNGGYHTSYNMTLPENWSSKFNHSTFNNLTFHNSTFNNLTFNNTTFNNSTFNNSTFNNSTFNNSTFNRSTFNRSTFNHSTFNHSTFNHSTFNH